MRRLLVPIAAGALLATAALLLVVVIRPAPEPTRAELSRQLAAELRCPDCEALSVADSQTRAAAQIRSELDAQLAEGRTADEVRDYFVDRYGEWILLSPRSAVWWLVPVGVALAGLLAFAAWLRLRSAAPVPVVPQVDEATRRRLRDEAEVLDA
jgi:cytochrome c-type biogenesis protein CcmH